MFVLCYRYNSGDHPIAFHKQEFGKPPKKISAAEGPAPDIEDAFDVSCVRLIRHAVGLIAFPD